MTCRDRRGFFLLFFFFIYKRPQQRNNGHAIFYVRVKYSHARRPCDGLFAGRFITGLICSAHQTKAQRAAHAAGRWCPRRKTKHTINTNLQSIHWTGARWRAPLQQPYIITSYLISSLKSTMDLIQPRLSLCRKENHPLSRHRVLVTVACMMEGIYYLWRRFKEMCNQH